MPPKDLQLSKEQVAARNQKIAALRERSGLSMDELAKEMGYKGQSSIQRYLSPDYDKGFRPEVAQRFQLALIGRGTPPISPVEVGVFDRWYEIEDGSTVDTLEMFYDHLDSREPREEFDKRLEALGLAPAQHQLSTIGRMRRRSEFLDAAKGARVSALPLEEGTVLLQMPTNLSPESAETLLHWTKHLVNLAVRKGSKK